MQSYEFGFAFFGNCAAPNTKLGNKVRRADLTARLNDPRPLDESVENSVGLEDSEPLWSYSDAFPKRAGSIGEPVRPCLCFDCPDGWNPSNGVLTNKRMVFRTWWAAGSWGPAESWPQILCRPLRLDSRRRSPERCRGLSGARYGGFSINIPLSLELRRCGWKRWAGYLVESALSNVRSRSRLRMAARRS